MKMRNVKPWLIFFVFFTLHGCASVAPADKITGVSQQEADAFIQKMAGLNRPAGIQIDPFYEEQFSTVTDTEFVCNKSDRLNRITNYVITKHEGNYVEISASMVEDCDNNITRYKLSGRYGSQWLFLKRPEDSTTYIFAFEILGKGNTLRHAGTYQSVNGVLKYQQQVRSGDKRNMGGYYYRSDYVSIDNLRDSLAAQQQILNHSRTSKNNGPSTASQIALFGSIFTDKLQQQQSLRMAEAAAAQRQREQVQASERRTAQRNEQMLASVAEERRASQQKQQYQQPQSTSGQSSQAKSTQLAQADTRSTVANDNAAKAAAALKVQQDMEKKRQEDAQRAKEASDRAREQEQNRQRAAKEKADKLAAEQAEKAAEQQKQKDYLAAMVKGIRLVATTCPDGEGHYYATGTMPKVKHETVSCIDVYYEASCPGSRITSNGVAKTFVGMSGCFGDTYQIDPKPACPVKQVRIRVTDVRPGCN